MAGEQRVRDILELSRDDLVRNLRLIAERASPTWTQRPSSRRSRAPALVTAAALA